MMRKLLLLWGCCLCLANPSFSQPGARPVSLYEYGQKVVCDSDNFANLRTNIALYVDKEGSVQIKDIAWKYIGEVTSSKQVQQLITKNYEAPPVGGMVSNSPGITNGKWVLDGRSSYRFLPYSKETDKLKKECKAVFRSAARNIGKGDRIYELTMTADGRPCTTYMFVNRKNHKVITADGCNPLGYTIKLSLIADKNKKRNQERRALYKRLVPGWVKQILTESEIATILDAHAQADSLDWSSLKQIAFDRAQIDTILKEARTAQEYNASHPQKEDDSNTIYSWRIASLPWRATPIQPMTYCKGDTSTATYLVYSQLDNYDAHVLMDIAYRRVGESLEIVRLAYRPYSLGGRPVAFTPFDRNYVEIPREDGQICLRLKSELGQTAQPIHPDPASRDIKGYDYLKEHIADDGQRTIRGDIKGTLTYWNAEFKKQQERVSCPIELALP